MSDLLNNADALRERAEDVRKLADDVADQETMKALLEIAEAYEWLAKRAEERSSGRT